MNSEQQKPEPTLEQLYAFRERVKNELLGVEDPEWRSEVEFLLKRTNAKIREVAFRQGKYID